MPQAALGALLIVAVAGLVDFRRFAWYYRVSRPEFRVCLLTTLGVITVGILPGILFATVLALLMLLARASRPHDARLGRIPGREGYFDLAAHPEAQGTPGLVVYRFGSALVYFNADYFRTRALAAVEVEDSPRRFLLDATSMNLLDTTGADALENLRAALAGRGVGLGVAGLRTRWREALARMGVAEKIGEESFFDTVEEGRQAFLRSPHAEGGAAQALDGGASCP